MFATPSHDKDVATLLMLLSVMGLVQLHFQMLSSPLCDLRRGKCKGVIMAMKVLM
jgi:hypothetical protein